MARGEFLDRAHIDIVDDRAVELDGDVVALDGDVDRSRRDRRLLTGKHAAQVAEMVVHLLP